MSNPFMESRITSLEISMADFKEIVAENSRENREGRERSDREFAGFQKEMRENQDRTDRILDELSREMKEFKDEMRQERRKHNLEMGRIANKQGRMAEDLVAPSICRIMKEAL